MVKLRQINYIPTKPPSTLGSIIIWSVSLLKVTETIYRLDMKGDYFQASDTILVGIGYHQRPLLADLAPLVQRYLCRNRRRNQR